MSLKIGMLNSVNEAPNDNETPGFIIGWYTVNRNIPPKPYFIGFGFDLGFDRSDNPSSYQTEFGTAYTALGYQFWSSEHFDIDIRGDVGLMFYSSNFDSLDIIQGVDYPERVGAGEDFVQGATLKSGIGIDLTYKINKQYDIGLDLGINFAVTDNLNPWQDGINDSYWNIGLKFTYKFFEFKPDIIPEGFAQKKNSDDFERVGVPVVGSVIKFQENSSIISNSSKAKLQEILSKMRKNDSLKVQFNVYVGSFGNKEMLVNLSVARAERLKQWLVSKGIAEDRIIAVGKGLVDPIYDNTSPQSSRKNDRVEIILK